MGFATRTEFYKKEKSVLLRDSTFYGTKLYPFLAPQSPWSSQLFKKSKQAHLALEANVDEINMDKEIRNAVVSKLVKEQVEELDVEKKREIVKKGDKPLEIFAKPPALPTQATSGEVQSSQGEVQLALSFACVARQALQRAHMYEWARKELDLEKICVLKFLFDSHFVMLPHWCICQNGSWHVSLFLCAALPGYDHKGTAATPRATNLKS